MDHTLKDTSIVNISAIDSARYPIMIETPTNWYNTQSLIMPEQSVGVNDGKLPKSKCVCFGEKGEKNQSGHAII